MKVSNLKVKNLLSLLLFLLFHPSAFAQEAAPVEYDYKILDSICRTFVYKGDLKLLVHELTDHYTTETEKARAIFVWIADNIAYDYKAINKDKKPETFKCNGKNCTDKYSEWENNYIKKVLKEKKAICDGYARLFKRMCDYAGLRTDIVSGYTKKRDFQIGRMGDLNHAWNGILLDGKYHFIDVTWAAGGCGEKPDGTLMPFRKSFNDYYWLTPADKFMRDHFPADKNHPLVINGSMKKYRDSPYIRQEYISNIEVLSHDSGIIEVCKGDTLHFKIMFRDFLWSKVQVNTNVKPNPNPWRFSGTSYYLEQVLLDKQKYVEHTFNNYIFEFDYIIREDNVRYIDILFDYNRMIRFKVKMLK